jgi:molybdopterin converting factor small subunit
MTLGDLLDQLQIPATEPKILLVNGLHVGRDYTLRDGDRVGVFPPIAGG